MESVLGRGQEVGKGNGKGSGWASEKLISAPSWGQGEERDRLEAARVPDRKARREHEARDDPSSRHDAQKKP
jgi:hypothetical protein